VRRDGNGTLDDPRLLPQKRHCSLSSRELFYLLFTFGVAVSSGVESYGTAAIGEGFGLSAGKLITNETVSGLRRLGFDRVFDTDFAAGLAVAEKG